MNVRVDVKKWKRKNMSDSVSNQKNSIRFFTTVLSELTQVLQLMASNELGDYLLDLEIILNSFDPVVSDSSYWCPSKHL